MRYVLLAVLATACGGQKLDGTIIGATFTLDSSASHAGNGAVSFVLASVDDICGALSGNGQLPDSQTLSISLRNTDGSGNPVQIALGMYAINATTGQLATVLYRKYGDSCGDPIVVSADSGTISLDTIDISTGELSGSLQIGFGDDHLTGSFTADSCAHFNNVSCTPPPPTTTN